MSNVDAVSKPHSLTLSSSLKNDKDDKDDKDNKDDKDDKDDKKDEKIAFKIANGMCVSFVPYLCR